MKIFGIRITFRRETPPPRYMPVILASVETAVNEWLESYDSRLREVEKKTEATRRKVYRELEAADSAESVVAEELEPLTNEQILAKLGPGDIVPGNIL